MTFFVEYAPMIIVIMGFFIAPQQLVEMKSSLIAYIADHYVSDKTYRENHRNLQEQLSLIHQDINDVKNLLIQKGGD